MPIVIPGQPPPEPVPMPNPIPGPVPPMPAGGPGPQMTPIPSGIDMNLILSVLAGAGFGKFASGMHKLSQAGLDGSQLLSIPDLRPFLAGAGLESFSQVGEAIGMKLLNPPQPPQPQQPQIPLQAILPALTARLGPGTSGLQLRPPTPGPIPPLGGLPPPPMIGPGPLGR